MKLQKTIRRILLTASSLAIVGIVLFSVIYQLKSPNLGGEEPILSGISNGRWAVITNFTGYETKNDPSRISPGANPQGQNTTIFNGDRVSVRDFGYNIFPSTLTASTTESGIESLHTFRKRSGENIMIRTFGTYLQYYEEGNNTWEYLKLDSNSADFGFADANINTDQTSYVYFGNAVDPFMRWDGAHTLTSVTVTSTATMVLVDDTNPFTLGNSTTTGNIIYCGQEIAYTDVTVNGLQVASAHECPEDRGVASAITVFPDNVNYPKGNIYLAANNRLFISGVTSTTQAVFFSAYADHEDFNAAEIVTDSTAASPGIFNLIEGGGGVTDMALDENSIYIFKRSLIYKAILSDSLYTLTPLKSFDAKSQTVGAIRGSVFTGGNAVYFTTPDNKIMSLQRVETIDTPQVLAISDIIKPTVDDMDFASTTGIVFKDKAYFSARSENGLLTNNTLLVWNIREGFWDSPILGSNASEFTIYQDIDDNNKEKLFYSDTSNPNIWEVTNTPLDYIYGVTANWRTAQLDFGMPSIQKEIDNIYIEGYIAPNTTLSISLLLDENGFTQVFKTDFAGTETDYLYSSEAYNIFGLSEFGIERFGSNDDFSGKKKFRIYLNKNLKRVPFYNAQIELASDGENMQWEVTAIGIHFAPYSQPEKRGLYRVFQ